MCECRPESPNSDVGAGNFGRMTSTLSGSGPRQRQLGWKLYF
jgi:hypothetical protein